jgi:hypothetical protein
MLLAFATVIVLLWEKRYGSAIVIFCGYILGSVIVHHATAGLHNVHQMPEILYLLTKIPANFLRDWLGVQLWTNGYAWCDAPTFTMALPGGLHVGRITEVGLCAPSVVEPLSTISSYLTAFGILPAVLINLIKTKQIPSAAWKETWWVVAFGYGALMTILGPFAGPPADRAIGFGWPLFLCALPAITQRILDPRLIVLNLIAAWTPLLSSYLLGTPGVARSFIGVSLTPSVSALSIAVAAIANVLAYLVARKAEGQPTGSEVPNPAEPEPISQ